MPPKNVETSEETFRGFREAGCGFIDYDNDGWPDILQINGHVYPEIDLDNIGQTFKNPRLVYRKMGSGQFKDVSSAKRPGITERFSSRGAAFGDYDNDGDIDVLVLYMNHLPSLLRNDSGNKQNWIKLRLIGTKCIRIAIGARVRVVTGDHSQVDEVHSGSSVMSQSDLACIWHRRSTNRRLNQETDVSYPESVSRGVARRHQSPNES